MLTKFHLLYKIVKLKKKIVTNNKCKIELDMLYSLI